MLLLYIGNLASKNMLMLKLAIPSRLAKLKILLKDDQMFPNLKGHFGYNPLIWFSLHLKKMFSVWEESSISKIFEYFNWYRKNIYPQQIKFSRNFTV
jgi:hypothetical protein